MKNIKFKYGLVILLLLVLCGNAYASDINATDSYSQHGEDLPVSADFQTDEATSQLNGADDEVLALGENETLRANDDRIYFNSEVSDEDDAIADGSFEKPYKYLYDSRIDENSNIYLFKGIYELIAMESFYMVQLDGVNIVGEDMENTLIYSQGLVYFNSQNTIANVSLQSFFCYMGDSSKLTLKNTIVSTMVLMGGSYSFEDSQFVNGSGMPYGVDSSIGGAIYCYDGENDIYLRNCSFINNTAGYGGAIHMKNGKLTIENCSFINNTAQYYGGAISGENNKITIKNTRFENNVANTNAGGAIYIVKADLIIENTNMTSSYAIMGGAVSSLNSTLKISKSSFKRNRVSHYGGALYVMYGSAEIMEDEFINNSALYGGAIFIDESEESSIQSDFINNSALIGGAIYSFKNDAKFNNRYDGNSALDYNDLYENDLLNLTVNGAGESPLFVYDPTDYTVLPDKYNLNDYGWVSSVKNQISDGNCWSFTAIAVLESCILKTSNLTFDFSEENMKNIMALYSDLGWTVETNQGGTKEMAIGYLAGWFGPVNDTDDLYVPDTLLSPLLKSIFHVQNVVFLKRNDYTDNDMIKDAILRYGAVGTSMYYNDYYLKNGAYAYYCDNEITSNHAVTIVGWDDTYSKNNFKITPPNDGAWIVKNSWGSDWGNDGYFYVSYYDKVFALDESTESAYTFLLNDTLRYDKNYQYDLSKIAYWDYTDSSTIEYYNIFTIDGSESLAAVSTYFNNDYDYTVKISVNGDVKHTQSGNTKPGYYTISLSQFISLKKGDELKVEFAITNNDGGNAYVPIAVNGEYVRNNVVKEGISFLIDDDGDDVDLSRTGSCVACIKAFTLMDLDLIVPDMNYTFGDEGSIEVISDASNFKAEIINHTEAIINITGKKITVTGLDAGNYTLSVTAYDINNKSKTVTSNIKVNKANSTLDVSSFEFDWKSFAEVEVNFTGALNVIAFVAGHSEAEVTVKNNVITVSNLDVGNYTLNVTTVADNNHNNVSKTVDFKVNRINSDLNILVDNIDYGEDAVIIINLNASARGNISISLGDISKDTVLPEDFTGTMEYRIPDLDADDYEVFVKYAGDAHFNPAQASFNFTVSKINPIIVINAGDISVGQSAIVNATLPVSGKVTIKVNGKSYDAESGQNVEIKGLATGNYTVIVNWNGDKNYNNITNTTTFNVKKVKDYDMDVEVNSPVVGENATITVNLPADATGNITVSDESIILIAPVKNACAAIDIPDLAEGKHTFTVTYTGDDKYEASSTSVIVNVTNVVEDTVLSSEGLIKAFGSSDMLNITLTEVNGTPLSGKTIKVTIASVTYSAVTDENGTAFFSVDLNAGTYQAVGVFEGTSRYAASEITTTVEIKANDRIAENSDVVKNYGGTDKFTVRALDAYGKPVGAGKTVKMTVNGKKYSVKTDKNGYASLDIDLLPGKYAIISEYEGYTVSNNITVVNVLSASDIQFKEGKSYYFTATLKGNDGKGISGKTISFTVKGKTYTAKTNSASVAKITLPMTLHTGSYAVNVKYGQYAISKILKIVK